MQARRICTLLALVLPLSIGFSTSCGGAQTKKEDVQTKKEDAKADPDEGKDKNPVSEKGKNWGGWRWKGKRDNCFYVQENKCFETEALACKAAACGDKKCVVEEGAPSEVTCPK